MTIDALLDRIRTKRARAGVIGLGYVGLPLAVEFARAGVATIGFDIDAERTEAIARGDSYVADVKSDDLRSVVDGVTLSATTDFAELARVDTINICVPTPLRKTRDPDLSHVIAAVDQVATHLRDRTVGGAGVDHVSRHGGRSGPPPPRSGRPARRQGLLPRLLAGANRPR